MSVIIFACLLSMMVAYTTGWGNEDVLYRGVVVSGFDNMICSTLNSWHIAYSTMRHPLLAILLWPLTLIVCLCQWITGEKYSEVIVAVVWGIMDVYSFLFIYRTLHRAIELRKTDSAVLTLLFFSFGFVMLGAIFPDHMTISLFILSTTLYVSAMLIKRNEVLPAKSSLLLFLFSTGVTTTNGVKVIFADFITILHKVRHGDKIGVWHFVRHFLYYILPIVILFGAYYAQNTYIIEPAQRAKWEKRQKEMKKNKALADKIRGRQNTVSKFRSKQIMKGKLFEFTDGTVPAVPTLVHNVFGESIQLHSQHLLDDSHGVGQHRRPQFVEYQCWMQYAVEAVLVAFLVVGIVLGMKRSILWVPLSWFLFDMLIHVVLKFAINDVFIMTVHWALIFPVALGFVLKRTQCNVRLHNSLVVVLAVITIYLWLYNGILVAKYLL